MTLCNVVLSFRMSREVCGYFYLSVVAPLPCIAIRIFLFFYFFGYEKLGWMWLVAIWQQGLLTIGSAPEPGTAGGTSHREGEFLLLYIIHGLSLINVVLLEFCFLCWYEIFVRNVCVRDIYSRMLGSTAVRACTEESGLSKTSIGDCFCFC